MSQLNAVALEMKGYVVVIILVIVINIKTIHTNKFYMLKKQEKMSCQWGLQLADCISSCVIRPPQWKRGVLG